MINYPVGNTGFSTNRYQSPVIGTPTGTYTGAMNYTPGVTGIGTQSPAFDKVQVPGLNGLNPVTPGNGVTTNASTNQILSMLITLIQSLIQSLQGGQSA